MANLPPFLSKAFKLTPAAKQTMAANNNDQGRVCELDPTNNDRVLTWTTSQSDGFDEMRWSQRKLYEAAQNNPSIRISRKEITDTRVVIEQRDIYNEAERENFKDMPNMTNQLVEVKLGFFQRLQHKYIYIISKKTGG